MVLGDDTRQSPDCGGLQFGQSRGIRRIYNNASSLFQTSETDGDIQIGWKNTEQPKKVMEKPSSNCSNVAHKVDDAERNHLAGRKQDESPKLENVCQNCLKLFLPTAPTHSVALDPRDGTSAGTCTVPTTTKEDEAANLSVCKVTSCEASSQTHSTNTVMTSSQEAVAESDHVYRRHFLDSSALKECLNYAN